MPSYYFNIGPRLANNDSILLGMLTLGQCCLNTGPMLSKHWANVVKHWQPIGMPTLAQC